MLAAALACAVAGGFAAGRGALGGEGAFDPASPADPDGFDACHRLIFHAVLEGLYEDGVSTELADIMLEVDPKTRLSMHLVDTCPICDPTRDAIDVYRHRTSWHYKGRRNDTFGKGLPDDLVTGLRSRDPKRVFETMQKLLDRWISRRLDLMRLTPEERAAWTAAMEDRRKKGMEMMKSLQRSGAYPDQTECPVCNGATDATKGK
jgi:hypothetical protein